MREHLYRAKRKDNGEWICGSLISLTQGDFILTTDHYNTVNIDLHERLLCNALWEHNDFVEVLPQTICEYAGLKDKNGRRIFEGDIVKCAMIYESVSGFKSTPETVAVKYIEGCFYPLYNCAKKEIIAIGNIYDNAELIKENTK